MANSIIKITLFAALTMTSASAIPGGDGGNGGHGGPGGCFILNSDGQLTLSQDGCSNQHPFVINDEVFSSPLAGTTNQYELAFSLADSYNSTQNDAFYALDVLRDGEYYQEEKDENGSLDANRGFFGRLTAVFDQYFNRTVGFGRDFFGNPDIADTEYGIRSPEAEDRRQRYIANTLFGLDTAHQLTGVPFNNSGTKIDAGVRLNDPVSLIHYAEAYKSSTQKQCKFMFLNLSAEGVMCRVMGGFGMDAWMPFFNQANITKMETNTITIDTENALLAVASEVTGETYQDNSQADDTAKISFLQNLLKPMNAMFDSMRSFIFGKDYASINPEPYEIEYNFEGSEPAIELGFAVTNDGEAVNVLAPMHLLSLKSVYTDHLNSCKVTKGFMSRSVGTFYDDVEISRTYRPHWWSSKTVTVNWVKGPNGEMTNSDWIDWCQEQTHKKGMLDYLTDRNSFGFMNPMNWMRGFFSIFDYKIETFTSTVKRGLIIKVENAE